MGNERVGVSDTRDKNKKDTSCDVISDYQFEVPDTTRQSGVSK